jgi:D-alanine-D-alanine ligase
MTKINKHIEIVSSSESSLSSMSKKSRDAVLRILAKHYAKVGITIINNLSDLEALVESEPDLVFLGMESIPADQVLGSLDTNKIWLSEYLDEHDIAYTGSSQAAHELGRDKSAAKQCVHDAGLETSPFFVIRHNRQFNEVPLAFPIFIKPTNRGGGLGIDCNSVAHNFEQLRSKVRSISVNLQSDSLLEEYLPGREFSVAILKDENSAEYLAMPLELITPPDKNGESFLSEEVKSLNNERVLVVTDEIIKTKVTSLAIDVFTALGGRDYGRIDIRLDKKGVPQFLEANLIPSLISGYGSFPKACLMNAGIGYEPMILGIVRLGLARSVDLVDTESEQYGRIVPILESALSTASVSLV